MPSETANLSESREGGLETMALEIRKLVPSLPGLSSVSESVLRSAMGDGSSFASANQTMHKSIVLIVSHLILVNYIKKMGAVRLPQEMGVFTNLPECGKIQSN